MGLLDGKVAIVTGAGHGVGRGHALALAAQGAKVVVNDLGGSAHGEGADTSVAQVVVDKITSLGGEAVANASDVSDFEGAKAMIDTAVEAFGGLDILVNNAGILRDKMIFSMTEQDFDSVVKVHLKGHWAPSHHACVYWRDKSKEIGGPVGASIVNTSSLVGLQGNVGQTNYAAAKAGIVLLTISTGIDMERYGVRANVVAPSGTTRLIGSIPGRQVEVKEPDEYEEWSAQDPGNVAPLVVYLASDLSRHLQGQIFFSNGPNIIRYKPFEPDIKVTVPGANRRWEPEEIGQALNSVVYGARHGGLMNGAQFNPTVSPMS